MTTTVVNKVTMLIEPIINQMGLELVDVEYLSEYGRWVLRVFLDKENGITLDDCTRVSHEIGDVIEINEILHHQYVLEVSSPGLDRALKKEKDFLWAKGKKIRVKMVSPLNDRQNFTGCLKDFHDETLFVEVDGGVVQLPLHDVRKANLVYEFSDCEK